MHILLLGASGRNGQLVLKEALDRSHTVTVLVRNPSTASLPERPNLTLARGSPTSQSDLEAALRTPSAPDVVISALGHRRAGGSPFAAPAPGSVNDLFEQTAVALIAAIKASHLPKQPKIVVNSSQGVGPSWNSMSFPVRFIFSHAAGMRIGLADHARMDAVLRESDLPFVLARPPGLLSGPAKPVRVWPDDGKGMRWMGTLTRESLAEWLVEAAEKDEWNGRAPVISN